MRNRGYFGAGHVPAAICGGNAVQVIVELRKAVFPVLRWFVVVTKCYSDDQITKDELGWASSCMGDKRNACSKPF